MKIRIIKKELRKNVLLKLWFNLAKESFSNVLNPKSHPLNKYYLNFEIEKCNNILRKKYKNVNFNKLIFVVKNKNIYLQS